MITGASSGIGRSAALQIGRAKGEVILVARTKEKLDEVAHEIEAVGGTGGVIPATWPTSTTSTGWPTRCWTAYGNVDVLDQQRRPLDSPVGGRARMTASTTTSGRCSSTTSAPVKLILDLLPAMRGPTNQGTSSTSHSIGVQTGKGQAGGSQCFVKAICVAAGCQGTVLEVLSQGLRHQLHGPIDPAFLRRWTYKPTFQKVINRLAQIAKVFKIVGSSLVCLDVEWVPTSGLLTEVAFCQYDSGKVLLDVRLKHRLTASELIQGDSGKKTLDKEP